MGVVPVIAKNKMLAFATIAAMLAVGAITLMWTEAGDDASPDPYDDAVLGSEYSQTRYYEVQEGQTLSFNLDTWGWIKGNKEEIRESRDIPSWASVFDGAGYFRTDPCITVSPPLGSAGEYTLYFTTSWHLVLFENWGNYTIIITVTDGPRVVSYNVPELAGYNRVEVIYYSSSVTLLSQGERQGYALRWYTEQTGGTLYGTAGHTVSVTSNLTLYGRWEQINVILPVKEAEVYVHYRGTAEYVIEGMIPPTATVTAAWNTQYDTQTFPVPIVAYDPATYTTKITIPYVELIGADYLLIITAEDPATGMDRSSMILKVRVFTHVTDKYDAYGLANWSVTVETNGKGLDTMELISATRSDEPDGAVKYDVSGVIIASDQVIYTFAAEGWYEFTVGIKTMDGLQSTRVLKIQVTNTIVSGNPWAEGLDLFMAPDGLSFYALLKNPVNFVEIEWNYGDGTILYNRYTSVYHSYTLPDAYLVSATLTNSHNIPYTVSSSADAIQFMTPPFAFYNDRYVAIVPVNVSSASAVTVTMNGVPVTGGEWIEWEFKTTDIGNIVRITGLFTDPTWADRTYTIAVIESPGPNTNPPWTVTLAGAKVTAESDFIVEISGLSARIKYTGTLDAATKIAVQWDTRAPGGPFYVPYYPTADGWMYHPYTSEGQYVISVSAIREVAGHVQGRESISSETVLILAGGVGWPTLGGGSSGSGGGMFGGSWSMIYEDGGPNYVMYVVIAVTAIIAAFAFITGRWYIGLPAAIIAAIVAIWEWIL